MRVTNTRTPNLTEVLRTAVDFALSDVHTALPGKVEKYDVREQKANVKPLLKRTIIAEDGKEIIEEMPVIRDVPIVFPRGGGFFLSFPVQQGDHVLLIFNDRSIDKFVTGEGADTDPIDLRMHNISDAVAIAGFYPFTKSIIDANDTDLVVGKDDGGAQIAITVGGIIEVTFDGGRTLRVEKKDGDAKLTVGDGAVSVAISDHLEQLYTMAVGGIKVAFDNHTHGTGVGPSGPPLPFPTFPPWNPSINSTKVKIPDG